MSHLLTHKSLDRFGFRAVFSILIFFIIATSLSVGAHGSQDPNVFTKCWELTVNSNLGVGPTTDSSAVYFLDDENKLHGIDLAAGSNLWSSEVGGDVISNLLVVDDSVFVVTRSQSDPSNSAARTIVRALSRQTGITAWQTVTTSSPAVWLGAVTGNVVVAGSDGSISAFSRADGKVVWQTDLASGVTSEPHFHNTGLEVGTENHEVVTISAGTGVAQVAWKSEYRPTAVLSDRNGRLVVGDERGNLILVSSDRNRVWRFRNGAQISSALVHDFEYLVASHDNFVYKLSRSGNVKWKRRLSGRAGDKPLILGDTAVVSVIGTGSVYTLDLKNGKILNRIETGDDASLRVTGVPDRQGFIVAGPRGLSHYSVKCPPK